MPSKSSTISAVTIFATIAPVNIVTRKQNWKVKNTISTCYYYIFPGAKYPSSLSSISASRKPSPVTTDYTHPRVDISGRDFINVICGGENQIRFLANNFLDIYGAYYKYFWGTSRSFVMNCS